MKGAYRLIIRIAERIARHYRDKLWLMEHFD